jgi:aldose 1-epimerase
MKSDTRTFGNLPDGREALLFTLPNDHNITVKITNYGAIITEIGMPDKNGKTENIVAVLTSWIST